MNKIEIIATILSIIGNVFIIFQSKIGFVVWIIANIFWVKFALKNKHFWMMGLFIIYTILAITGLFAW